MASKNTTRFPRNAETIDLPNGQPVELVKGTRATAFPMLLPPGHGFCAGVVLFGPRAGTYCGEPLADPRTDWCGQEAHCVPAAEAGICANTAHGCRNLTLPRHPECVLCDAAGQPQHTARDERAPLAERLIARSAARSARKAEKDTAGAKLQDAARTHGWLRGLGFVAAETFAGSREDYAYKAAVAASGTALAYVAANATGADGLAVTLAVGFLALLFITVALGKDRAAGRSPIRTALAPLTTRTRHAAAQVTGRARTTAATLRATPVAPGARIRTGAQHPAPHSTETTEDSAPVRLTGLGLRKRPSTALYGELALICAHCDKPASVTITRLTSRTPLAHLCLTHSEDPAIVRPRKTNPVTRLLHNKRRPRP